MQLSELTPLCRAYAIGELKSLEQIHGGLLHRMWKVTTTQGTYALKELNSHIALRPEMFREFKASDSLARTFAEHSILCVHAILHKNEPIFALNKKSVVLYPWIEGTVQDEEEVKTERIQAVATTLAQLHAIGARLTPTTPFHHVLVSDEELNQLAQQLSSRTEQWALKFIALLPIFLEWNKKFPTAYHALEHNLIVSHRDLNKKNIVWDTKNLPHLIDWEGAGTTNPTLELVGTTLEWSKNGADTIDEHAFRSFVQTYSTYAQVAHEELEASFLCKYSEWLHWLKLNLERATLDKYLNEREIGIGESEFCLIWLETLFHNLPTYITWIRNGK